MIVPSSKYPGQIDVSDLTNYPQGKARNRSASGATDGTPAEKAWLNDLWGWMQALVGNAGIAPSNTPDTAVASQLFDAVTLAKSYGAYQITASVAKNANQAFPLTLLYQKGGYTLASDVVTVPAAGRYLMRVAGTVQSTDTTTGLAMGTLIKAASGEFGFSQAIRYSTAVAEAFSLNPQLFINIATPASSGITVISNTNALKYSFSGLLFIERVG